MLASVKIVRVFNKPDKAQGNQAAIFFIKDHVELPYTPTKISADIKKEKGIDTTCFISMQDAEHYKVQCFNKDNAIQYCGHGMIAAAKVVFEKCDLSNIIINNTTRALRRLDESGAEVIELKMPRMTAKLQAVPEWTKNILTLKGEKVIQRYSAVSDKNDGYLLLEIDPLLDVKNFSTFKLDINQVCNSTKRAVVVIQFDHEYEHLYMRYFAPQYGVAEDTATGSVMRFVADYIAQRYECNEYDVSQCSLQGGFMQVVCMAESVKIIANATYESDL